MEQLTNFERVAPYYLKVYDDNTIEIFNRKNLPVGLTSDEEASRTEPVILALTPHRIRRLKELSEVIHEQCWVYYFTGDINNPSNKPKKNAVIERYLDKKRLIESIYLGL
jgi:hypothetical protein